MNDEQLKEALDASPAFRVTEERENDVIVDCTFHRLTGTLTVAALTLANGFTVTGESACASIENYRKDIGEEYAYRDAKRKIGAFEAYAYLDREHRAIERAVGQKLAQAPNQNDGRDPRDVPNVDGETPRETDRYYGRSAALDYALRYCGTHSTSDPEYVVSVAQKFDDYLCGKNA